MRLCYARVDLHLTPPGRRISLSIKGKLKTEIPIEIENSGQEEHSLERRES